MSAPPANVEFAFNAAIAAAGFAPQDGAIVPADGKIHRFLGDGDKPGRRNGWAVLYPDGYGLAGSWRTGERMTWISTRSAREHRCAQVGQHKREAERKTAAKKVGLKAKHLYDRLPAAPLDHAYLTRKGIPPHCAKLIGESLVLPVRDIEYGEMISLQFITPDGEKRYSVGSQVVGGNLPLGSFEGDDPLVVAEGFATGASIHAATNWPVCVAFTAGNLLAVGRALRRKFPERTILFGADNDATNLGNPGVAKATEAAREVSGRVVAPSEPGDWNDMALKYGADEVRAAFEKGEDAVPEKQSDSDESTIERLSKLPPLEYDRAREAEAVRLGVRVGTLDESVKRARVDGATIDPGQGRAFEPHDPEPWPEPVSGAELLNEIAFAVGSHVRLPAAAADAVALWVAHAHAHDAASISPILAITSAAPGCGKTTLLNALTSLVPRALAASNVTSATIFRAVEKWKPTLLIDEADSFLSDNEELRGVLNSGHARAAAYILRTVGDNHEPRAFTTWSPKAIALIGALPATLESRSIHIELRRTTAAEQVEPLRADGVRSLELLARKSARWAADHLEVLRDAEPDMPADFINRTSDNWRPLFALGDAAGGDWPARARAAAAALTRADAGQTHGIALLADVREIFVDENVDRMASAELAAKLAALEDRPWPEWVRSKAITPRQVARLLAPFGIAPANIRNGTAVVKGYQLQAFADAFKRYLPDLSATPLQTKKTEPKCEVASATAQVCVAAQKAPERAKNLDCSGVADQTAPQRRVRI